VVIILWDRGNGRNISNSIGGQNPRRLKRDKMDQGIARRNVGLRRRGQLAVSSLA